MDPNVLWKKSAARAAKAPGNVVTGALTLAASAALWNPLPLILWGLGSTAWVLFASTSGKYMQYALEEERAAQEKKAEQEREALQQSAASLLSQLPFAEWIRHGQLPDYLRQYRGLLDIRDRVARIARERREIQIAIELGIQQQLNSMLKAYLQFVWARIQYLQILVGVRTADRDAGVAAPAPKEPQGRRPSEPSPRGREARGGPADETAAARPLVQKRDLGTALPRFEDELAEIEKRIQNLKALAQKEPAAARARVWHIDILEKKKQFLQECQKRDQCVAAQLSAFPDAFDMILGRVSATQIDVNEVTQYMGNIIKQVEETEQFVEALRPAMGEMLEGMDIASPMP